MRVRLQSIFPFLSIPPLLPLLPFAAALPAQVHTTVVPSAYAASDANSYVWLPGASQPLRQQTLVGGSHLQGLVGHEITAIAFRRTAAAETYHGGTADLAVTMSTAPHPPLQCAREFARNVGPDATSVFQGPVALPTSPPEPGPAVPWTASNVVEIALQQPFRYQGGTLCVDITGATVPGQIAAWWMADAVFEDLMGSAVEVGAGCGAYGGAQGQWSHVAERSLLGGAHANLWAYGPPGAFAFAVFGAASPVAIPLPALGIASPGCFCHLQPNGIAGSVLSWFEPHGDPLLQHRGGRAALRLWLPDQQWILGAQLTTQWFDLGQLASSNAIRWTVAASLPALDLALVDGHPQEASGEVSVHLAHVLRLQHRP